MKSGVENTVKGALRVGQTTGTLAKQGLGWILGDGMPVPARLRQTFEELGATYIKLGQFIASSPASSRRSTLKNSRNVWIALTHCLSRRSKRS